MIIKIAGQEYTPEFIDNKDEEVWRITDRLIVEKGDKTFELKSVDYGELLYSGNDMKVYHCKPINKARVNLLELTKEIETIKDKVNEKQLRTMKMVEYIGIPNTDAATPLNELYDVDAHLFTVFKSDLLSGACIGIEQPTKSNSTDNMLGTSFRICHFFVFKPFQGYGIGRKLYTTVKDFVNASFEKLTIEDPNELFSNLRDHCDLEEFKINGGLMSLKSTSVHNTPKKQKLDPMSFVGKYAAIKNYIKVLEVKQKLSPVFIC